MVLNNQRIYLVRNNLLLIAYTPLFLCPCYVPFQHVPVYAGAQPINPFLKNLLSPPLRVSEVNLKTAYRSILQPEGGFFLLELVEDAFCFLVHISSPELWSYE
jgi:hypothetical protein